MYNEVTYKKENTLNFSLGTRLRYMFSGYKTQIFIDTLSKKAPKYILTALVVLLFIYVFLHPVDKIKLLYFFTRDCTIDIISKNTPRNNGIFVGSYESREKIRIDGDWVEADGKYYNFVNGEVYCYSEDMSGEWQKEQYKIDMSSLMITKLLNRNNYVIDISNPFVWKLKEDAYEKTFSLSNIRIQIAYGSIAIVGDKSTNGYTAEVFICFNSFGTTNIEFPWDE